MAEDLPTARRGAVGADLAAAPMAISEETAAAKAVADAAARARESTAEASVRKSPSLDEGSGQEGAAAADAAPVAAEDEASLGRITSEGGVVVGGRRRGRR